MRLYIRAGTWYVETYYYNRGSKSRARVRRSTGIKADGRNSRRAAEAVARAQIVDIADDGGRAARPATIAQTILHLGESMIRAQRADATIEIVVEKSEHLYRILGATTPLEQITLAELERYVDTRLSEGAHRGTIEREIRTLRQAWRAAKRSGLVDLDPPPSPDLGVVYTPKERWLPRDEVLRLLDALPAQWCNHVVMYLHLGIRASELYRITLADCNFDSGELRVRGTKTEGADRVIAMTPEVRSILLSTRSVPFVEPGDRLFRPWTNHDRDLKRACEKAKIAPCSLNDLRRTYATETARAGVPITTAAKLMGHTDTRMLSRVYAQVASEDRAQAAAKLPRYRDTLCQIRAENNGHSGNNEDNGGEKTA